jgi:hypothetical protein
MEARWGHIRQVHKLDFCGSCFSVVPHDDIGLHLAKCLRLDLLPLAGRDVVCCARPCWPFDLHESYDESGFLGRSGASESTVERPTPLSTVWTPSAPSLVSARPVLFSFALLALNVLPITRESERFGNRFPVHGVCRGPRRNVPCSARHDPAWFRPRRANSSASGLRWKHKCTTCVTFCSPASSSTRDRHQLP